MGVNSEGQLSATAEPAWVRAARFADLEAGLEVVPDEPGRRRVSDA